MGGQIKSFDRLENLLRLRKNVITLPEVLSHLRYDLYFGTAIGVAFHPLRGRTVLKRPQWYDPSARADELLSDLAGWIAGKSGLFFAYLQLGDLHEPLKPPDDFRNHFGNVKDLPLIDRWNFRRPEEQQGAQFQEYRENRILLYDNTLRNVDRAIERFCGTLKDRGLLSSTILIITADHGEEFWEHAGLEAENFYDPRGYYGVGHGHNVFNEIIQVPVVIAGPGVPEKQYAHVISTVDIVPTALDLLGIEHRLKFDGQNVFQQQATGTRLLSEASGFGYEKKALIIGRFKLIYSQDDGVAWVFDLEKDPQELHPITEQGVVSMFVDKLSEMQRRGEARRIREKIEARSLTKL
jgi:arylsulfatase A-like enzyme